MTPPTSSVITRRSPATPVETILAPFGRVAVTSLGASAALPSDLKTRKAPAIRGPAYHVNSGDTIIIDVPEAVPAEPKGEDIALDIVFEDDDIIVLNKPKGLVVHPAAGHETGTLVNALIAHCGSSLSGIGGGRPPRILHPPRKGTPRGIGGAPKHPPHPPRTAHIFHY